MDHVTKIKTRAIRRRQVPWLTVMFLPSLYHNEKHFLQTQLNKLWYYVLFNSHITSNSWVILLLHKIKAVFEFLLEENNRSISWFWDIWLTNIYVVQLSAMHWSILWLHHSRHSDSPCPKWVYGLVGEQGSAIYVVSARMKRYSPYSSSPNFYVHKESELNFPVCPNQFYVDWNLSALFFPLIPEPMSLHLHSITSLQIFPFL